MNKLKFWIWMVAGIITMPMLLWATDIVIHNSTGIATYNTSGVKQVQSVGVATNGAVTIPTLGVITLSIDGASILYETTFSDSDITNVGDIALDTISADDGSSFAISSDWTNAGNTVADLGIVTTVDINGGTIDGITDLKVADGGTGVSALTDHCVFVGSGTDAATILTVGGANEVLCGAAGADPSFRALTDSDIPDTITVGSSSVMTSPPAIGGTAPNTINRLSDVVNSNTDITVTTAHSGALYTNKGATTAVIYTLPTASAGQVFLFSSVATDTTLDLTITAASGDKINGGTAAGSYAANETEEKRACTIIAVDDTDWRVISEVGTWVNQ